MLPLLKLPLGLNLIHFLGNLLDQLIHLTQLLHRVPFPLSKRPHLRRTDGLRLLLTLSGKLLILAFHLLQLSCDLRSLVQVLPNVTHTRIECLIHSI